MNASSFVRFAAAILLTFVLFGCGGSSAPPPAPSAQSVELQQKRWAFIQKLTDEGFFQKVEIPGSLPHLWVTPQFMALDFDTKAQFVNVVYAYYKTENPSNDLVILYHSKTGKKSGSTRLYMVG